MSPAEEKLTQTATDALEVSDKARALVAAGLVWDNILPWIPGGRLYRGNADSIDRLLQRFRAAGVNVCSLSIAGDGVLEETMCFLARLRREIAARSEWLTLAGSIDSVRDAHRAGKLAVNFNFQGTAPFAASVDMVSLFYELGVRQAGLAYNLRNRVGDGCAEEADAGLSRFGREIVREMNRVGMVVDGSHAGYRTSMDAMQICQAPFIFSHSNPAAVHPHYRNIRDDQIKACAATGGIIGINGVGGFVGDAAASAHSIFRCLDYVAELVGPEHVGIALDYVDDFEGAYQVRRSSVLLWPGDRSQFECYEFAGPERIVELAQLMLDHGYPQEAILGILGENWARLAQRVWANPSRPAFPAPH